MEKIRLISITKPLIDGIENANDLIAYVARVSNPTNQNNTSTSDKLVKYLIDNRHWSPFELVDLTFEINTTRDIARQLLRHRSFTFQEFSQRYADPTQLEFSFRDARLQDMKNRQNSIITEDEDIQDDWIGLQDEVLMVAKRAYRNALDMGIAKEVARVVLPEGMTGSRLYMHGSLRSWIHYCAVRTHNGTQLEHQLIASNCWEIIQHEFPILQNVDLTTIFK